MGKTLNVLVIVIAVPVSMLLGLVSYYWITYIDETVESGSAYGFDIGLTKEAVVNRFDSLTSDYPKIKVYVTYGTKAGENFTISATKQALSKLVIHDRWDLLLDGEAEFFNTIDLHFKNGVLAKIHRHRQHFELP